MSVPVALNSSLICPFEERDFTACSTPPSGGSVTLRRSQRSTTSKQGARAGPIPVGSAYIQTWVGPTPQSHEQKTGWVGERVRENECCTATVGPAQHTRRRAPNKYNPMSQMSAGHRGCVGQTRSFFRQGLETGRDLTRPPAPVEKTKQTRHRGLAGISASNRSGRPPVSGSGVGVSELESFLASAPVFSGSQ